MQSTKSKSDFKLELAFALAMIISLAGCGMPSHINISGQVATPTDSVYVIQNPAGFDLKIRLPRRIRLDVRAQLAY